MKMYRLRTTKQLKYFDEVIRLHYEKGYGEDRIASILPVGHSTVSRWIAIFASQKGGVSRRESKTEEMSKMWHSYREEAIKNLKKARKQPISPKKVYLCIPVMGLLPGYALQSTHDRNKLT